MRDLPQRFRGARLPIGAATILLFARAATSQPIAQPIELTPSFRAGQTFDAGVLDQVSLYSGDTQLDLPIGPAFVLSLGPLWRLPLAHSGRFVHMWRSPCAQITSSCGTPYAFRQRVTGHSPLGAGWTLELAHIILGSTAYGPPLNTIEEPGPRRQIAREDLRGGARRDSVAFASGMFARRASGARSTSAKVPGGISEASIPETLGTSMRQWRPSSRPAKSGQSVRNG